MDREITVKILDGILAFLRDDARLFLPERQVADLATRAGELRENALQPGEVLYVGLLGGTGVGKSTLINALAGQRISDPSDRRPFTDKAVVYRHHDTERGLQGHASHIKDPDAEHTLEHVKDLVLLDLPDFDSHEEENRKTVESLLPALDAVIWVVSPEKYADRVFYDLVARTNTHSDNFTFVFNKADELLDTRGRDSYAKLKEVLGDFLFRLRHETGVGQPRLFAFSARQEQEVDAEGTDEKLREEFLRFRQFLMARRDAKEIASIKTVNLVEQTRRLLTELDDCIRPNEKAEALERVAAVSCQSLDGPRLADLDAEGLRSQLSAHLRRMLLESDPSLDVVHGAATLLAERKKWGKTEAVSPAAILTRAAELTLRPRKDALTRGLSATDSVLALTFSGQPVLTGSAGLDQEAARAVDQAIRWFQSEAVTWKGAVQGRMSRILRLWQRMVLFLPVPFFLVKLAGPYRVEAFLDQPGGLGLIKLVLGMGTSLFGSEGFVALVALLGCEGLLVLHLARRRVKKIGVLADRLAGTALDRIERTVDQVVRDVLAERNEAVERLRRGVKRFGALKRETGQALGSENRNPIP